MLCACVVLGSRRLACFISLSLPKLSTSGCISRILEGTVLEISLGSWVPGRPISHLATAHKGQSTGISFGSKRHPGVRRVWGAPCARHEDARYTTKKKERPLRRRQNEKRPAPFCASRVAQAPRARDFPFYDSSTLPARATGRPVAGASTRKAHGPAHGPTSRDSPTNDDHLLNGDHGALAATDLA